MVLAPEQTHLLTPTLHTDAHNPSPQAVLQLEEAPDYRKVPHKPS